MDSRPLSRRRCLQVLGAGAAALSTASLAACAGPAARRDRPNVVFILADDLGYGDLGSYGAVDVRTPNIDALAAGGTRLMQFYVTSPVCMPSRLAFITGRQPDRGIDPNRGMAQSEVTLGEMFRAAGYRTGVFGKWHLGIPLDLSPNNQGFDEFVGFKNGAMDNWSHYFYWGGIHRHVLFRDETPLHEEGTYFPDIVVREATRFVRENQDRPFFLYLPFNLPHYPLQPPPEAVEAFKDIQDPLRRRYAAWVSTLDDRVGQVLACLEDEGLRDNTIVVFSSDHGPSDEERGGGGSAGLLKGTKDTLWEGGIRVPFVCSWPGVIPAGQQRMQPVMSTDLLPTLAAWCGIDPPERILDGRSIAPIVAHADAPPPRELMNWVHGDQWAVRRGPWKVLAKGDHAVLLNLDEDPGENRNYGAQQQDLAAELIRLHEEWRGHIARGEPVD